MARIAKIATTSLATLEDTAPPFNLRYPEPADTRRWGCRSSTPPARKARISRSCRRASWPPGFPPRRSPTSPNRSTADRSAPSPSAPASTRCTSSPASTPRWTAPFRTSAALIDRSGRLVGIYSKQRPTEGEIDNGVMPGTSAPVFETDFGRVGLAICFDLNWQDLWAEMAGDGAELVCWISAYEGGLPLQAYAWIHQYAIVTSVWPYHARVIERTGKIVAQTSRWGRLAFHDLNLDKRLFHTDGQQHQLVPLLTRYGSRIRIESFTEEHLFTLESVDPDAARSTR